MGNVMMGCIHSVGVGGESIRCVKKWMAYIEGHR